LLTLKNYLSQNELNIFRTIYEAGPISRVEISRRLNLTRAAVSIIMKRLTEFGLILEVGKGASSERRGRREVLLTVNPDAGFVITVHIALSSYDIGLVDLTGKVLEKKSLTFQMNLPPTEVLEPLTQDLTALIERNHLKKEKIFGIVIAIPGVINYAGGYVRELTLKSWQGFEVRNYFEERFDIKVLIENDVKTYTLGEFQFGTGKHVQDMICLWLGDGIGAGIITNGRLIRGISSSAGEIGFNGFIMEAALNNKSILTQNNPKCWGDTLSLTNIKDTIKRGIKDGWHTNLKEDAQISDFVHAIETRDPLGLYIFRLLSQILGTIGQNLVYTFNPEILLLSGPLVYQLPRLASEVRKHLDKGAMKSPLESVEIKTSMLGANGILIGGVALMLEYLFNNYQQHN
jgi:N-acetylglucosamine repressor